MPVTLLQSQAPAPASFDRWLAATDTPADAARPGRMTDVGRRLEDAFDACLAEWQAVGHDLAAQTGNGRFAHTPTASPYNCDFGLMMTWVRIVEDLAKDGETTLVWCDDPWLFRALAGIAGVSAGSPPGLAGPTARLVLRGYLARTKLMVTAALAALRSRATRANHQAHRPSLIVYPHPASTAEGHDAYFGSLMAEMPELQRLVHSDGGAAYARRLAADGRTAAVHAWGHPLFALTLPWRRWRVSARRLPARWAWLVRRAAVKENGGAAVATNLWQAHCQRRWLRRTRPTAIVWPWENHPWERQICREAAALGIRTVGYQHTVIGPHQTNFAPRSNPDGLASLPGRIVCNGPAWRRQLEGWGIPADRLTVGGAFRIARFAAESYDADGPVYVALSAITPIARQMMEAVDRARRPGRVFVVKDHPLYPFDFATSDDVRRTDKTIPESSGLSAVLFGTGTTGMEGLLAGLPTYRLMPEDRVAIKILPDGVEATPVTVESFAAGLDSPPVRPTVRWEDIYAPVDFAVWRHELG